MFVKARQNCKIVTIKNGHLIRIAPKVRMFVKARQNFKIVSSNKMSLNTCSTHCKDVRDCQKTLK